MFRNSATKWKKHLKIQNHSNIFFFLTKRWSGGCWQREFFCCVGPRCRLLCKSWGFSVGKWSNPPTRDIRCMGGTPKWRAPFFFGWQRQSEWVPHSILIMILIPINWWFCIDFVTKIPIPLVAFHPFDPWDFSFSGGIQSTIFGSKTFGKRVNKNQRVDPFFGRSF